MQRIDIPRRIWQDVSVQQIGTETLAYDGQRQLAFCMNASSAVVWRLADGMRSIGQISEVASMELGAEVSEDLVRFILETLRNDGLIEPIVEAAAAAANVMPRVSRRVMLQRLGTGGAMLLPVVASIVAPTAAQAYNGCVDCSVSSGSRTARIRKLQQSGDTSSGSSQ